MTESVSIVISNKKERFFTQHIINLWNLEPWEAVMVTRIGTISLVKSGLSMTPGHDG